MSPQKILVIASKMEVIEHFLFPLKNHFHLQVSHSIDAGTFLVKEWEPDVIVYQWNSQLQALNSFLNHQYPILRPGLIVVGEPTLNNEEFAFANGADHFVGHNYEGKSLLIRSQALCQKNKKLKNLLALKKEDSFENRDVSFRFEDIEIFPQQQLAKKAGKLINLSPIQFNLLKLFITSQDQLLSRQAIQQIIWGGSSISPRSIDAQISKLKKVVPLLDEYLLNIYGKGYILTKSQIKAA